MVQLSRAKRVEIALSSNQAFVAFDQRQSLNAQIPKVAIIARVSSQKQKDEGTIESQLKFCHELYSRYFPHNPEYLKHISLNEAYNLETKDERFDFWTVIDKIRSEEINTVIAVSMDRIFRGANKILNAEISQVFTNCKIRLITSDGVKNYDPQNIHGLIIDSVQENLGVIAKKEMTRKLQKARRYHLTEHKKWRMAVVPFGYRLDIVGSGREKKYIYSIIEEEANLIRDIYKLYTNQPTMALPRIEGQPHPGVKLLAAHLNRLGVSKENWLKRVPDGHQAKTNSQKWNAIFINRILTNPIYRGDLIVCFNQTKADAAFHGEALAQKIAVPPIVSIDLWEAANKIRNKKNNLIREQFAHSAQTKNWLHRIVLCSHCHKPLGGYTSSSNERYYTCRYQIKGKATSSHPTYRAADLERNIGKLLLERLAKGVVWERMIGVIGLVEDQDKDYDKEKLLIENKQKELDQELTKLTELLLKGIVSDEQYTRQKERIENELNQIKTRLSSIQKQTETFTNKHKELKKDIEQLQTRFHEIMSSPNPQIFSILREAALNLIEKIEIVPLSDPKVDQLHLDEIKTLYKQGRILPKLLLNSGWSDRKINKLLGRCGRKSSLNFNLQIHWKSGKNEILEAWTNL